MSTRPSKRPRGRWFLWLMASASVLYPLAVLVLLASMALFPRKVSFAEPWSDPAIRHAFGLSILTSLIAAALATAAAIPSGYALSRWRFPGRRLMDILLYLPIALPPLVIGVSLLIFFQTPGGRWIERHVIAFTFSPPGIVLAQSIVAAAFAVRVMKLAFDAIPPAYAGVARTLGATRWQAFRRVELAVARGGVLEAFVLAWAVAIGSFGPVTLFCGITRFRTEVLSSSIFLEFSVGNLDRAIVLSLWMAALTGCVLVLARARRKGPLW